MAPVSFAAAAYHKVSLDEPNLLSKPFRMGVRRRALNLIVIVVEAGDVDIGKLGNLASRSSYAATNVQNFHAALEVHLVRQVVFVARERLDKGLALAVAAKVKRLRPAILIQIRGQIVIAMCPSAHAGI